MASLESELDPALIGPSVKVVLSQRAQEDLEGMGRLTRSFLARTIRDELLAPTDASKIESLVIDGEPTGLYKVGVGKFSAVFKPLSGAEVGELQPGRAKLVERILPTDEVHSAIAKQLGTA